MSEYGVFKDIEKFKNTYQGERIFLIGNGPSLSETPLDRIDSEYSLAMNNINKIYDNKHWRPSFYYASQTINHPEAPYKGDTDFIKENIKMGIPCFLRYDYSQYSGDNVYHVNVCSLHNVRLFDRIPKKEMNEIDLGFIKNFWSNDVSKLIYHYHSMYGALQLVKYMGFSEVYLLGCDLGLKYFNPHMIFESGLDPCRYNGNEFSYLQDAKKEGTYIRSLVNGIAYRALENPIINEYLNKFFSNSDTYFTDEYTERFRIHDGPRVDDEIEKSHLISSRIFEKNELEIYNSTRGGNLDIYDRKPLPDVLNDS